MLQRRASLLAAVREFFASRAVLEVDTAQLLNFAVTDPQLHSAEVRWPGKDSRLRFPAHLTRIRHEAAPRCGER